MGSRVTVTMRMVGTETLYRAHINLPGVFDLTEDHVQIAELEKMPQLGLPV